MIVVRVFVNALILAAELAGIAAIAVFASRDPLLFAAFSAALALVLGLALEAKRLRHEWPFYFGDGTQRSGKVLPWLIGLTSAAGKGVLAGIVALLTVSGTEPNRLFWTGLALGATIFAGSSLLRALSIRLNARPARWGYFRLAVPLGILFTTLIAGLVEADVLPTASLTDLGRRILFETPSRPSVAQASELLFEIKQYIDAVIVLLLGSLMSPEAARVVGIFLSVNVLTGFVAAVYATAIAGGVRLAEDALLPGSRANP